MENQMSSKSVVAIDETNFSHAKRRNKNLKFKCLAKSEKQFGHHLEKNSVFFFQDDRKKRMEKEWKKMEKEWNEHKLFKCTKC